jgi:ABC-type multidrug transport system fused ATPase/permease subunit
MFISSDLAKQVTGSLASASNLATKLGSWLSIAVLLAAIVIASLLTISAVGRRTRELGTLKALGWRTPRVVVQVVGEALTQGVIGGGIGLGLGVVGAWLVTRAMPALSATVSSGGGASPGQGRRSWRAGRTPSRTRSASRCTRRWTCVSPGSRSRCPSPAVSPPAYSGRLHASTRLGRENTMFIVNDLTKRYRRGRDTIDALRGVDITIDDGEFLAIRGPTGHGKSTLLQLLGGLDRQASGSVEYDGRELGDLSERQLAELRAREFGFIFRSFNLIPTLTAAENVETALVPLGVPRSVRRGRS